MDLLTDPLHPLSSLPPTLPSSCGIRQALMRLHLATTELGRFNLRPKTSKGNMSPMSRNSD
ncbi:hypothetical protein KC19_VG288000 [Ceratodon purpureus]|uniref:Uncharacterized protein n=1 Tax=Ceratodon purpureus TaxID=3225 RepID=A0A8T0HUT9_CERPU|nr:hypothetical protein KC19_VG288000 [Ceratodon purpureus]